MARQAVFSAETRLWHPIEGWRSFPAGESDPGGSWHEQEGGEAPGSHTTMQAMMDLIAAQEQIEALQAQLDSQAHDLSNHAEGIAKAEAKVAGLEQRAIAAEKALAEAEQLATQYMRERDAARTQLEQSSAARKSAAAKV